MIRCTGTVTPDYPTERQAALYSTSNSKRTSCVTTYQHVAGLVVDQGKLTELFPAASNDDATGGVDAPGTSA